MRKRIVAGNWKMNKTPQQTKELINVLKPLVGDEENTEVVFCPPFICLTTAVEAVKGTNIKIGAQAPVKYIQDVYSQCETGEPKYGVIANKAQLIENLNASCMPVDIESYELDNYDEFLAQRRVLMAEKIQRYYESL